LRSKYSCFIEKCNKSYLYICTLKKHLAALHEDDFRIICEEKSGKTFLDIYKEMSAGIKKKPIFSSGTFVEKEEKNGLINGGAENEAQLNGAKNEIEEIFKTSKIRKDRSKNQSTINTKTMEQSKIKDSSALVENQTAAILPNECRPFDSLSGTLLQMNNVNRKLILGKS
jgi:hypothetical protein